MLDNAHAGGVFCAVLDDGTLKGSAFSEFKDEYKIHPDTQIRFDGYRINGIPRVLEAAKKMASAIPQVPLIHWDFTIEKNGGPCLIEGNMADGGIWFQQMTHGTGLFGENTGEILGWMRQMKKLPASQWKKYRCGKSLK